MNADSHAERGIATHRTHGPPPGPGTVTIESLEALELAIGRRVDGLLAGDYRSAFAGVGSELYQVRPYNRETTFAGSTGT